MMWPSLKNRCDIGNAVFEAGRVPPVSCAHAEGRGKYDKTQQNACDVHYYGVWLRQGGGRIIKVGIARDARRTY